MKQQVYGTEIGNVEKVSTWLSSQAKDKGLDLDIESKNDLLSTQNFGDFELFSMSSDSSQVRKLLLKAGKRFGIKMIEGGYKEKARIIRRKKSDYARVLKGDKILGHLELETSRFGSKKWEIKLEERR
ncbi:hypothetical protein [Nitrosopumilus sp.]|uniref:hypothetical protein n=1 Tax=Nitrosopumilus sp. TaxID=2024843 RepID=UPI002604211F|nr:hypothetical protein [Nitrosopumilus sp.]